MELPNLGKQCFVSACSQLDFLPIQCTYCKNNFCKDHSLPIVHLCQEYTNSNTNKENNVEKIRYSCQYKDCKQWELTPVKCHLCSLTFCLQHRLETDHSCANYVPPTNKMADAAAKLDQITKQMSDAPSRPKAMSKKAEKMAAKVQLMKLKMKASGRSSIPSEDRIYFNVCPPKSGSNKSSNVPVYIDQNWSIGRTVDEISDICKVPNFNNVHNQKKLVLYRSSDGVQVPTEHTPKINELLKEELLINGQTIILEYVAPGCNTNYLENYDAYI